MFLMWPLFLKKLKHTVKCTYSAKHSQGVGNETFTLFPLLVFSANFTLLYIMCMEVGINTFLDILGALRKD